MVMNVLENCGHVGDLVEEVKLSLVEVFGRTRQRTHDLLHHLLQQLPDVSYTLDCYYISFIEFIRLNEGFPH